MDSSSSSFLECRSLPERLTLQVRVAETRVDNLPAFYGATVDTAPFALTTPELGAGAEPLAGFFVVSTAIVDGVVPSALQAGRARPSPINPASYAVV